MVSDLPGTAGDCSTPGDVWAGGGGGGGKQPAETTGGAAGGVAASAHGWSGPSRCALLMASATFIEEVMGVKGFPRMKAMRCFSASLRCGRAPAVTKGKALGSGSNRIETGAGAGAGSSGSSGSGSAKHKAAAPPAPFSLEEVLPPQGSVADAAATAMPANESPGGMRLEDLLAIAGGDPPGALLVDSKWRTCR